MCGGVSYFIITDIYEGGGLRVGDILVFFILSEKGQHPFFYILFMENICF